MFGRRRTKRARPQAEVRPSVPEDRQAFLVLAEALYEEFGEERLPRGARAEPSPTVCLCWST